MFLKQNHIGQMFHYTIKRIYIHFSASTGKCHSGKCEEVPGANEAPETDEQTKFVGDSDIPPVSLETPRYRRAA